MSSMSCRRLRQKYDVVLNLLAGLTKLTGSGYVHFVFYCIVLADLQALNYLQENIWDKRKQEMSMRDTPSPPTVTTPTQEVEAKQSKEEKTSTSATAASTNDKGKIVCVRLPVVCDMLFDVCH